MPFVGHCIRCGNPVFGAYVAFPAGPAHPECAQAAGAQASAASSPSKRPVPWGVIAIGIGVFVVGIGVMVATLKADQKDYEKRKAEEAAAKAGDEKPAATTSKERAAFLYCDPRSQYCEQPELAAVNLYGSVPDFSLRDGLDCRRSPTTCTPPSKPSLSVTPGTKVTVVPLPVAEVYRRVSVEDGPHKGKVGLVDPKYVHDEPRR